MRLIITIIFCFGSGKVFKILFVHRRKGLGKHCLNSRTRNKYRYIYINASFSRPKTRKYTTVR